MGSTNTKSVPRTDLMGLVREHVSQEAGYIGMKALPRLAVPGDDFQWPVVKREQLFNAYRTVKGRDGTFPMKVSRYDWENRQIKKHGLRVLLDPDKAKKYRSWFDMERVETIQLVDDMRRDHEIASAALLFSTSTFTGRTAGVSVEWSTAATCTPVDDVKVARDLVHSGCGKIADTAIMSYTVRSNLGNCKQIRDRLQYTMGLSIVGDVGDTAIAAALGVKRLLVGNNLVNAADQGLTATPAEIWDDEYCLICCTSEGDTMEGDSAIGVGRTAIWEESTDDMFQVSSHVDADRDDAEIVVCKHFAEPIKFTAYAGYLLSNITA